MARTREERLQLFDAHSNLVEKVVHLFGRRDQEDDLQDAQIVLWQATDEWNSELASFRTFAFSCIKHYLLKPMKWWRPSEVAVEDIAVLQSVAPSAEYEALVHIDANERAARMLHSLSDEERQVFGLRLAGYLPEEIGVQLGLPAKQVRQIMRNARKRANWPRYAMKQKLTRHKREREHK